jgi:2-polyprenyl-3-methyl-5-hydroxy-6-metoxy-1,4-benzoquinol methylase
MICKICNEDFGFKNEFLNVKDSYSYVTCQFCGSGFLYPMPDPKTFQEKYLKEEYYENLSGKKLNLFLDFLLKISLYSSPVSYVLNLGIKNGEVLDIGCGNGEFLNSLKKQGFEVSGSDFSELALSRTQKLIGISKKSLFLGDFSKIKFDSKYNIISFWHVLEHVEDPSSYIKKSYSILENDGVVVGEVPNYDSAILKIFKENYNWIMIPEHINYFSERGLRNLLLTVGYKDIKISNPNRAILNFTFSFKNFLNRHIPDTLMLDLLVGLSILFSIPFMIILSYFKKGEVLRFYAKK